MNQAVPSTSFFPCPCHWISAAFPSGSACCCYQKDNFLPCFTWESKTNCNTEVVQRTAALNTVLVKKIMWYLSFCFPSMNHPHLCLLYLQVLYFRFSQWWRNVIWSMLEQFVVWVAVFQRNILLVSSAGCLKRDVVSLFRTVSIPDLLSVWKDTISMLFGLIGCHEMEGRWGLVWNTSFGCMISHSMFYSNKVLF